MIGFLTNVSWSQLWFAFPWAKYWVHFHVPVGHSSIFFEKKMSIQVFCQLFNWIIWFIAIGLCDCIFWILTPYHTNGLHFFPIPWVAFPLCWWFPLLCRSFKVWVVTLVYFVACALVVIILKIIVKIYIIELFFSGFFSRSFTVSGLILSLYILS